MRPAVFLDRDGTIIEERGLPRSTSTLRRAVPLVGRRHPLLDARGLRARRRDEPGGRRARAASTRRSCGRCTRTSTRRLRAERRGRGRVLLLSAPSRRRSSTATAWRATAASRRRAWSRTPRRELGLDLPAVVRRRRHVARRRARGHGRARRGMLVRTGYGTRVEARPAGRRRGRGDRRSPAATPRAGSSRTAAPLAER